MKKASKPVRVALIGVGGIAQQFHLNSFTSMEDQCEVVALSDVADKTLKEMGKKYGVETLYSDYKKMLKEQKPDAVVISTPNALHCKIACDCIKAGSHVFIEKPMAINAEECKTILRTAKKEDRIVQIALQWRFLGATAFLKQFIDSGKFGDVYFARAQALRRRGVPTWGVFIDKEKQGGGPLIDIGVHILDLTLYLMGYPKPVSVSAQTWNALGTDPQLYNRWGDYDRKAFTVEDFAVGFIRFENGAVVSLESSFMANLEDDPFATQLFGTKAGAVVKPFDAQPLEIYTEVDRQLFDLKPRNLPDLPSPYLAEARAFVEAVATGKESPVPGEQGLILNAIFDAMYASSETGKEQPVDISF